MPQSYAPEFKKKIVCLHAEEGRTYKSITAEYGVSKASISKWCSEFSRECQTTTTENTGRRIIMPGGRKYCQKLQIFITNTMA